MKPADSNNALTKNPTVNFSPRGVIKYLVYTIILLLLAHIAGFLVTYVMHIDTSFSWYLVRYFDLNLEDNFPSFFSALILAFAALLLFVIYACQKKNHAPQTKYWLILGLVFVFLSTDECIQLHEVIAKILRPSMGEGASGLLYWTWVVPYSFILMAIVVYFLKFVLGLPKSTRNMFIAAGFIFVAGALGLEFLEGYFFKRYGMDHIYNRILYFFEEGMEMSGVTLFIYALLDYMALQNIKISFAGNHDHK